MPTYSRQDRLEAIKRAGFADPLTALAVSLAEFGENRDINTQSQSESRYANGEQEQSFGPWQIHLPAHPDVSRSCAMDLECSTAAAKKISKGGTDFGAWSAFTNGAYQRFVAELQSLFDAPATSEAASPGSSAGGASAPASGTSAAELPTCGLDAASMTVVGDRIRRGESPVDIAADMTARLGRPISVECLRGDAYRAAGEIGRLVDNATKIPVVGGAAQAAAGGIKTFADLAQPDNLWRAGFLALGAALIFFGARMYLSPGHEEEVSREGVAA